MKTYTINEISKISGLPASTLRYYEGMNLLPKVGRSANNQRIYTDEHICRLNSIQCFKNTGLAISKIQDFFHYEENLYDNIEKIISLVTEHEENINIQIQKLQQDLEHIHHKVLYYNAIKKAISDGKCMPCWNDFS